MVLKQPINDVFTNARNRGLIGWRGFLSSGRSIVSSVLELILFSSGTRRDRFEKRENSSTSDLFLLGRQPTTHRCYVGCLLLAQGKVSSDKQ